MRKIMSAVWSALISAVIFIGLGLDVVTTKLETNIAGTKEIGSMSAYDFLDEVYKNVDDCKFIRIMTIVLIVVASILALIAVVQIASIFFKSLNKTNLTSIAKFGAVVAVIATIIFLISAIMFASDNTHTDFGIKTSLAVGVYFIIAGTIIATVLQFINAKIFKK